MFPFLLVFVRTNINTIVVFGWDACRDRTAVLSKRSIRGTADVETRKRVKVLEAAVGAALFLAPF